MAKTRMPSRRAARSLTRTPKSSTPEPLRAPSDESRPVLRPGDDATSRSPFRSGRILNARRDTPDLRDILYVPTLVEVPPRIPLEEYRKFRVPILDQGTEGACTGYGLATVIHYLFRRRVKMPDKKVEVSPHMLYRMARRYDEWPGEQYAGSSARGAMKGWHRHGVCSLTHWPRAGNGTSTTLLTADRAGDALKRPLGAYFRVNHQDLVAMHAALAEVGILYATASCHQGWDHVSEDGKIRYHDGDLGGHAFSIVAYDQKGFWIQNSWGDDWGLEGFGHLGYDDWLKNGNDVWVARLGAPIDLQAVLGDVSRPMRSGNVKKPIALEEIRPHIVGIGNDGCLRTGGVLGTDREAVDNLFETGGDFDRITKDWPVKRLLLYAHGGLNNEEGALQRVQDYRRALIDHQVFPVAFIWKTDYWTTIQNILEDAKKKRRPEGFLDATKNFLLNRLDDALEPIARIATGKIVWEQMKTNARDSTEKETGGARYAAQRIAELMRRDSKVELHMIGHSAGSVFHGPLVRLLTSKEPVYGTQGLGLKVKTVTMWAPACTIGLFRECYEPAIRSRMIERFALFTLTDKSEQDDNCALIYNKSLLYLVSHAFEENARIPGIPGTQYAGEPLLGMEWWIEKDRALVSLLESKMCAWVKTPNTAPEGSMDASTAQHHGDFDDDTPTVKSALARILGAQGASTIERGELQFENSAATWASRREVLMK
ncbi:MAG TPA: C1 family peptidase [Candidatus Eisenbacteria bacterium]|nr:C1 family peptidase [Candidatus Eisenbacteria bacterium]